MTCRTTHHLGCACHEARRDAETAQLRRDLDERDAALRVLTEEVRRVERERDDYAKTLRVVLDVSETLRAENARLTSTALSLRDSRYALEGQCRELHRALATRKARIARQRADAERFRVERNAARAERDAAETQLASVMAAVREMLAAESAVADALLSEDSGNLRAEVERMHALRCRAHDARNAVRALAGGTDV